MAWRHGWGYEGVQGPLNWRTYDHYYYASIALLGTAVAAAAMLWVLRCAQWQPYFDGISGIAPQFLNVLGVLFALNLAFLANDTWNAYDRALAAVNREADALRSIVILAGRLPAQDTARLRQAAHRYAGEIVAEWPLLARRQTSPGAEKTADDLLALLSNPRVTAESGQSASQAEIGLALSIRDGRETRLSLSQTHVNPLKWAVMAFLGFLTMLSVALIHIGAPDPMLVAVTIFALASAPTAAIVLVHGNPFQPPTAVSPTPLVELMEFLNAEDPSPRT